MGVVFVHSEDCPYYQVHRKKNLNHVEMLEVITFQYL